MTRYEKANKRLWNELTDVHVKSYGVDRFKRGESTLDEIQLSEMGSVQGKSLLHLQCHFGLDTLSWEREGASVTGVDFSDRSIEEANRLKDELGMGAQFICCNVYDLRDLLDDSFDVVYTSQGVLCWLRDLREWAGIIDHFLKPRGRFYIMEEHPVVRIFDDQKRGPLAIEHPYFHSAEPTKWDGDDPDYSDEAYVPKNPSYEWQWTLSDIVNSLLEAGLRIEFIHEYEKMFYKALPEMKRCKDGWWYLPGTSIPLIFTLRAHKQK